MFKFLKSKKGFTLVELMIVVVIMAILVAVAVPIYSAVTANARKRTCIGNMREIVSQLTNYAMSNPTLVAMGDAEASAKVALITSTKEAGSVSSNEIVGSSVTNGTLNTATTDFAALFQSVPYCPAGGAYTVKTYKSSLTSEEAGSMKVKVTCGVPETNTYNVTADDLTGHVLSGN